MEDNNIYEANTDINEVKTGDTKSALIAFILSLVGVEFAAGGFIGTIICAIAMKYVKRCDEGGIVTKNPYKVFRRIAKPVAIVGIILGIVMTIVWIIYGVAMAGIINGAR